MPEHKPDKRPNIVLLTVDCWRGDHIGLGGDDGPSTPNIDRFAQQGTWFSDAYTCGGWTKISMTALLSSTFSSEYNFAQGKIEEERPFLPEMLQKAGYQTIGITTNPVCGSMHGFDRGFDHFTDVRPEIHSSFADRLFSIRGSRRLLRLPIFRRLLSRIGMHPNPPRPASSASDVIDLGLPWLQQKHDAPFFLWLHFMDLHWPYESKTRRKTRDEVEQVWRDRAQWAMQRRNRGKYFPGSERAERWKMLYRQEVEQMDSCFGRLFDALYDMDDWQNTHVVLTSDHGEELFEHGTWAHSWNQLHREGAHVPLIVRIAGNAKPREFTHPVSNLDIAPTIAELAQLPRVPKMRGKSLLDKIRASECGTSDPVYVEMHGHRDSTIYRLAIINEGHKYIYDGDRDRCFLFDLAADPDERNNIYDRADACSRKFDRLRLAHVSKGVLNILKSDDAVVGEDILYDLDADPKVIERLRALGYLD
ncbi:sulfatase [Erythrobacter sp. F6033]|uniref:sulfatase n=1 Tax=Erythrobacter sp. F6033 TaxID=2926401 RepID=UPI001FF1840B|nr:sulfatase [Erythrobacter sp. F6033]MCK0127580.1 sulfatase [Erythrobacter sp. F6033]